MVLAEPFQGRLQHQIHPISLKNAYHALPRSNRRGAPSVFVCVRFDPIEWRILRLEIRDHEPMCGLRPARVTDVSRDSPHEKHHDSKSSCAQLSGAATWDHQFLGRNRATIDVFRERSTRTVQYGRRTCHGLPPSYVIDEGTILPQPMIVREHRIFCHEAESPLPSNCSPRPLQSAAR